MNDKPDVWSEAQKALHPAAGMPAIELQCVAHVGGTISIIGCGSKFCKVKVVPTENDEP